MATVKIESEAASAAPIVIRQRATEAIVVPLASLEANDYNPNRMPGSEMDLLRQCIEKFGFLFPIVVVRAGEKYKIVDGFHRYETLRRMGAQEAAVVVLELSHADVF